VHIQTVAEAGDGFEYWVTDGTKDYGLEVRGTIAEDIEARHRAKVAQFRANPYQMDGFVVVASFGTRTIVVSRNKFEGPGHG
jgi:hypothetical protein